MKFQNHKKAPENRGEESKESIKNLIIEIWLGWRDSNSRMPGPKPGALPLGDIPINVRFINSFTSFSDK